MNPASKFFCAPTHTRGLARALTAKLCVSAAALCLSVACTPSDPVRPPEGAPQANNPAPDSAAPSQAAPTQAAPDPALDHPAPSLAAADLIHTSPSLAQAATRGGAQAAAQASPRRGAMASLGASCAAVSARAITAVSSRFAAALTAQRPLSDLTATAADLTADAVVAAHLASDAAASRAQAATARVPRAKSKLSEPPKGAPRNTRQVAEGYWLGSEPLNADEVAVLHSAGVRVIISAVGISAEANNEIERLGISHLSIFFGRKFPDSHKVLRTLKGFRADEVFVHCEYGGDRSGVMIAFLLAVREGWRPDHALLAMTVAQARDVDGLLDVLGDHGLVVTEEEVKRYLSIYAGRFGGLKVRNHGYKTLVTSTLLAMSAHGVSLTETPARLDTADTKPTP
jgi:hypothetical protein